MGPARCVTLSETGHHNQICGTFIANHTHIKYTKIIKELLRFLKI